MDTSTTHNTNRKEEIDLYESYYLSLLRMPHVIHHHKIRNLYSFRCYVRRVTSSIYSDFDV